MGVNVADIPSHAVRVVCSHLHPTVPHLQWVPVDVHEAGPWENIQQQPHPCSVNRALDKQGFGGAGGGRRRLQGSSTQTPEEQQAGAAAEVRRPGARLGGAAGSLQLRGSSVGRCRCLYRMPQSNLRPPPPAAATHLIISGQWKDQTRKRHGKSKELPSPRHASEDSINTPSL